MALAAVTAVAGCEAMILAPCREAKNPLSPNRKSETRHRATTRLLSEKVIGSNPDTRGFWSKTGVTYRSWEFASV